MSRIGTNPSHEVPPVAPASLDEALRSVKTGEPVIFDGVDGNPVAALITIEDLRFYEKLFAEEEDRVDGAAADAALAEPGENIPWERVQAGFDEL